MRIIFLGTPDVAASCLETVAAGQHEIVSVVTLPDKAQGRGMKLHPTPVKEMAQRLGLPTLECPDAKDPAFADTIRALEADLLVVVAFVILPHAVLAATRLGAVNLHGSLLPRWRGAAPVQRSVEAGEKITGASVFRLDTGVDTGGVLLQEKLAVGEDETSGEVLAHLGKIGGPLLLRAISLLEKAPQTVGTVQDPALATRAPKLFPEEGEIDWTQPAVRLHDKIRAFNPAPGAWSLLGGERFKIWRTHVFEGDFEAAAPGEVRKCGKGRVAVATGAGALELIEVQPQGKKRLSGRDWFNGQHGAEPPRLG